MVFWIYFGIFSDFPFFFHFLVSNDDITPQPLTPFTFYYYYIILYNNKTINRVEIIRSVKK